jgi:hypothetical protein
MPHTEQAGPLPQGPARQHNFTDSEDSSRRATYRTYRFHYCDRVHRSTTTTARCIWRYAAWIAGRGPWAVVCRCGVTTVTLWPDLAHAVEALRAVSYTGCGHNCSAIGRGHQIVYLDVPVGGRRAAA